MKSRSLLSQDLLSPPLPTLMIIPSGVGCEVGGYAGDGIPSARLLAAASGCLITHPNVMNGASLYWNDPRMHYVEGWALDSFAAGELALKSVCNQKIGVILDSGMEQELCQRQLQVVDACRATLGLTIGPVVKTDSSLEVSLFQGESGASLGTLERPDSLIRAAEKLIGLGATAIAVVARFPDVKSDSSLDAYRKGDGVDALAGAEAVISHLIGSHFKIPCAHAPAMPPLLPQDLLDPRVAAEEIGYSFLACVLVGLSRAPNLIPLCDLEIQQMPIPEDLLFADHLGAVVAPEGALGGPAVLASLERGTKLITVKNDGILKVFPENLGLKADKKNMDRMNFFEARNYAEAAGWLMLIREGINREAIERPISSIDLLSLDS